MPERIPRALLNFIETTHIPLCISDPNLPDDPVIVANAAFYAMTGFNWTEVIGRNCRFMQGADTHKNVGRDMRADFQAGRDSRVLIRNYKRNGEPFDNFVYIFTVHDVNGAAIYRIGSQFEVPEKNKAQAFRAHFLALRQGLEQLNAQTTTGDHRLVDLTDMMGLSAPDLLFARLQRMRADR